MDLRIEIRPGSDPISGVVHAGDPPTSRPFTGWMGLVDRISAAVAEADENPAVADPPL